MSIALEPPGRNLPERSLELALQQRELRRLGGLAREPLPESYDDDFIDLRHYWQVLLRRRRTLFAAVVVALVVALVWTYNATPIYRSKLLLQIEPQTDRFLEYQQQVSLGEPVHDRDFYKTEHELLKSRSLARRVIDQLGLEAAQDASAGRTASFLAELKASLEGWIRAAGLGKESAGAQTGVRDGPTLEDTLLENLSISPIRDSRLVNVQFDSPNPKQAAAVANAVAENFISMSLERRYEARSYAKRFLEERIEQVRANLEDSEQRLLAYAKEREIVNLDDRLGGALKNLESMTAALVTAEAARIQAEAEYHGALQGTGPASLKVLDSPVIQKLKERRGALELQYQEDLKVYKPGYPKMQQTKRQLEELDQQIGKEVGAIQAAAKSSYDAKAREQAALQKRVGELKGEILAMQARSTDYQALKREADTNRELYDGLLQRMKEVGVVAGLSANNIFIVDRAEVPQAAYKPNLRQNLAIAIALGLAIGILLAFLLEHLDDTVKSSEDVETRVGAPTLGIIPKAAAKDHGVEDAAIPLLAAKDPTSPLAEAARSLRTSLVFSTTEGAPKVLHLTSANPGEGKTTVATSIAITFAQAGGKVLLIDADLRKPSLHHALDLPSSPGLVNYLTGDLAPAEIAQPTEVTRLFAITSGPLPPNPVELLSSAKMLELLRIAGERFDYVVIDGPPVIGLADALVLANLAKATIVVADAGRTRYGTLEGAVKRLRGANANLIGAVTNRVSRSGRGYGYGYGYGYDYHYSYNYGTRALPERV